MVFAYPLPALAGACGWVLGFIRANTSCLLLAVLGLSDAQTCGTIDGNTTSSFLLRCAAAAHTAVLHSCKQAEIGDRTTA